jgi:hypothetical protein
MFCRYQNPHEAQLLFGRGFRAGMDRREQKKVTTRIIIVISMEQGLANRDGGFVVFQNSTIKDT